MSDIVYIKGLKVSTKIGVFAWEKRINRPLLIDIEMSSDVAQAAVNDDIGDALNYDAVSQSVIEFARQHCFNLIETFAERLAAQLLEQFKMKQIRIKLGKPGAISSAEEVGVIINRCQEHFSVR